LVSLHSLSGDMTSKSFSSWFLATCSASLLLLSKAVCKMENN